MGTNVLRKLNSTILYLFFEVKHSIHVNDYVFFWYCIFTIL